jgi:hypothetical protein
VTFAPFLFLLLLLVEQGGDGQRFSGEAGTSDDDEAEASSSNNPLSPDFNVNKLLATDRWVDGLTNSHYCRHLQNTPSSMINSTACGRHTCCALSGLVVFVTGGNKLVAALEVLVVGEVEVAG